MDINLGNPLKFPQSEFKTQMESEIRSRCSEGVLFELHDRLFTDLKNRLKPISQSLGTRQISEQELAIEDLRHKIERNVKESELQKIIFKKELLNPSRFSCMEMRIEKNGSQRGARIDIYTSTGSQGEIIELKRASHPLIAYKNKNSARPSKLLIRGVKQTERYGTLILALKNQEKLIKKQIPIPNNIRLRLIAGRRLKSHNSYTLINALRSESPNITIQSWDAFLAECVRIFS